MEISSTDASGMADALAASKCSKTYGIGNMTLTTITMKDGSEKIFVDSASGEIAVVGQK